MVGQYKEIVSPTRFTFSKTVSHYVVMTNLKLTM